MPPAQGKNAISKEDKQKILLLLGFSKSSQRRYTQGEKDLIVEYNLKYANIYIWGAGAPSESKTITASMTYVSSSELLPGA
ncbi:hypothetical protein ACTXT7_010369 [Hymenolepis weldensis]